MCLKVRGKIEKWLDHLGLSSERSSIVLQTDAERAVSELVIEHLAVIPS